MTERDDRYYTAFIKTQQAFMSVLASVIVVGLVCNAIAFGFYANTVGARLTVAPEQVFNEVQALRREVASANLHSVMTAAIVDSPNVYVRANATGIITHWSRGSVAFFGRKEEEAVGQSISFIMPPSVRQHHREIFRAAMDVKGFAAMRRRVIVCTCMKDDIEVPVRIKLWIAPGYGTLASFEQIEEDLQ